MCPRCRNIGYESLTSTTPMSSHQQFDEALDEGELFEAHPSEELFEPTDAGEELDFGETFEEELGQEEFLEEPPPRRSRRGRGEPQIEDAYAPVAIGGTVLILIGGLLLAGSIVLAGWSVSVAGELPQWLVHTGLRPFDVFSIGLALLIIAALKRGQDMATNRTAMQLAPILDTVEHVSSQVAAQVEAGVDHEEFAQIPVLLQRLDEKITNLSKATKMYGKPLIDVATQMQGAAQHLQEIEQSLDSVVDKVETSSEKLGHDLGTLLEGAKDASGIFPREEFEALVAASQRAAAAIEEVKLELATAPETPKNDPAVEGLQQSVDSIRGEIQGLVQTVRGIATAPASAAAPAAGAPKAQKPAAPAPTPQSTEAPAKPAGSADGLANQIAGERKTKGKNVLGAIAKLKQMRN